MNGNSKLVDALFVVLKVSTLYSVLVWPALAVPPRLYLILPLVTSRLLQEMT